MEITCQQTANITKLSRIKRDNEIELIIAPKAYRGFTKTCAECNELYRYYLAEIYIGKFISANLPEFLFKKVFFLSWKKVHI